MIYNSKLKTLTEDELSLLGFIINDGRETPYDSNQFCWLRPTYVYKLLNEYATKIKPENKQMLQIIVDKIINNPPIE